MKPGHSLENLLYGGLHLELRGSAVNIAIRQLHQEGIVLRHLRVGRQKATTTVCLREFSSVYRICRANHLKLRFLERFGAPFWIRGLLRRKTMIVGPLLFLVAIYSLSSMVWQINISGVDEETKLGIQQAAAESGLYVGAWKGSLKDAQGMQDALLQKLSDVTWVGVDFQGSRVHIDAIEQVKQSRESAKGPHNIVAAKPGVIRHVFATRGNVLVQPGQVVHPGEVIISGNLGDGTNFVPAEGKALAEVWYTSHVTVSLKVSKSGLTGQKFEQGYLMLGGLGIHLWGWKHSNYKDDFYHTDATDWKLGQHPLPLQWHTVTTYEVQKSALNKSVAKAKEEALQLAKQDVQSKIGKDGAILSQIVLHEEASHGKLYEKVWTKTEENIGVAKSISEDERNKKESPTEGELHSLN